MNKNRFTDILKNYGQKDFIRVFENMSEEEREHILKQADLLDFGMLKGVKKSLTGTRGVISPIKTLTMEEMAPQVELYRRAGLQAIREGKVGAVVLAGGMGTRLGLNKAKGMCDIGITREVFIFQRMMENIMDVTKEAGAPIMLFVMTSYINDAETREFFKEHDYFGYDPEYVVFFVQDMAPCLDADKKLLLEAQGELSMSPNGNGGFYSSMIRSGVDVRAKEMGVEYLNVFAVDNVLQRIADPVFIGAVIEAGTETGAKVVKKADPDEKVGVICLEDGAASVVEYYEMTDELRNSKDENGEPAYNYGVILNYLFRMSAIDKVVKNELPVHVVKKKVPYLENGVTVEPSEPNGYKLETLTLDLVHLTDSCLSFEVDRKREFAPIKNKTGVDSVDTARALLQENGYIL